MDRNWYEDAALLMHFDYHTNASYHVGEDADEEEIDRLLKLSGADSYQIHAKGNKGFTTYPSKIGYNPPYMTKDIVALFTKLAHKHGKPYSCYYNIGRDAEIMVTHPEWNRVDASGTPCPLMICYNGTVIDEYIWPQLEEIIDRYHPDGFWFDGSCFTVQNCYCDTCRRKFKKMTGLEAPRTPEEPGWDEYKEMHRQGYRNLITTVTDRIKKKDPNCLVTFNVANSLIMPEKPAYFDYLTSDYIEGDDLCMFYTRIAEASEKPFELMTGVWQLPRVEEPYRIKTKTHLQSDAARALTCGGRFNIWDNPTPGTRIVEARMKQVGYVLDPFIHKRKDVSIGTKRVPDASVFYGAKDLYAKTRDNPVCFLADPDAVHTWDGLTFQKLNFEAVLEADAEQGKIHSGLLILDDVIAITDQAAEGIRKYAQEGGRVLLCGRSCQLPVFPESDHFLRTDKKLAENYEILQEILPETDRTVYSDLPNWAELTLREKNGDHYLHIYNINRGAREEKYFPEAPDPFKYIHYLMSQPEIPAGKITIRSGKAPRQVSLVPSGRTVPYTYEDGRITVSTPEIECHEVVVINY